MHRTDSASKSARIKGARIACEFGSTEAGHGGSELAGALSTNMFACVLCSARSFFCRDSFACKNFNKTLMSTKSRSNCAKGFPNTSTPRNFGILDVLVFQLGESLATLAAWAWETQSETKFTLRCQGFCV